MTSALRSRLAEHRPGYPFPVGRTVAIYSGLMIAVLIAALDTSIVSTALPSIVSSLGGLSSYAWMFSVYLLCQTVTMPIYGRLGDIYGRRRMFFVSIPIFLAGSALCGIAQSMPELIICRGIQGLGAGGVIPLAMATTAEIVPPRDRGRFAALISAGFAGASILGPTVGGLIVDSTSWRWIFYINIPIGLLALAVIGRTMPRLSTGDSESRVDYLGAALLAGATTLLLLALRWGGRSYPWVSGEIIGMGVGSAFLGLMFVSRMLTVPDPIIPVAVVGKRAVATGMTATCLSVVCQFGATAFVPLFAQGVLGYSAVAAGVALMPLTLSAVTATILTGQWVSRTGRYRGNVRLGAALLLAGMVALSFVGVHTTATQLTIAMVLLGVGSGAMMQTLMLVAQSAVPSSAIGSATSSIQFSRAIGTTVGVTALGAIVDLGLPGALRGQSAIASRLSPHARLQLASALHPAFLLGVLLCVLVLVVVWVGIEELPLRASTGSAAVAGAHSAVSEERETVRVL